MNNNTKILIGVGVAALVLLIAFAVFKGGKQETPVDSQQNQVTSTPSTNTATSTPSTTVKAPVTKPVAKPSVVTPKQELDYNVAVKKYDTSGYRMQFVSCGARPGSMTVKKGALFMIDNRDAKAHIIKVGKTAYSLSAYGWKIISIGTVGRHNITCDGGGSGFVDVQA